MSKRQIIVLVMWVVSLLWVFASGYFLRGQLPQMLPGLIRPLPTPIEATPMPTPTYQK